MPAAIDPMAPKEPPIPDEDAAAPAAFAAAVAWGAEASSEIGPAPARPTAFRQGPMVRIHLPPAASQERTVARANERALKPGTWPVWLGEAPTDVAQLEVLLAPYPSEKMIC
jgi:hypothetical protein